MNDAIDAGCGDERGGGDGARGAGGARGRRVARALACAARRRAPAAPHAQAEVSALIVMDEIVFLTLFVTHTATDAIQ